MEIKTMFDLFLHELHKKGWKIEKQKKHFLACKDEELFFYFYGNKSGVIIQRFFTLTNFSIKNMPVFLRWLEKYELKTKVLVYYLKNKIYLQAEADVPYKLNYSDLHSIIKNVEYDFKKISSSRSFHKFILPGTTKDMTLLKF